MQYRVTGSTRPRAADCSALDSNEAVGYFLPLPVERQEGGWHQGDIIQPDAWPSKCSGRSLDAVLLLSQATIAQDRQQIYEVHHRCRLHRRLVPLARSYQ